jgi:hypothetical protein
MRSAEIYAKCVASIFSLLPEHFSCEFIRRIMCDVKIRDVRTSVRGILHSTGIKQERIFS